MGIERKYSSDLISLRAVMQSFLGIFKSNKIIPDRGKVSWFA